MKPRDLALVAIIGGALLYAAKLKADATASDIRASLAGVVDWAASLPGQAAQAIKDGAAAVVNGDSPISDKNGGGFVKEAGPARIVDYKAVRDTAPLIQFFIINGNTDATRASAARSGWSQDEISLSVLAMASANGSIDGW